METAGLRHPWKALYLSVVICGGAAVIAASMAGLMAAPAALPLFALIGLTIVILSNRGDAEPDRYIDRIADIYIRRRH